MRGRIMRSRAVRRLPALTMLLVWRTRLHLLWLLSAGALVGALGWLG